MNRYPVEPKYADHAWAAMADSRKTAANCFGPSSSSWAAGFEHSWFSLGDRDAIVIVELPDNVSAEALRIAGAAGGGFKVLRTVPLLTTSEAVQAMQKAGALRSGNAYRKAHKGLTS